MITSGNKEVSQGFHFVDLFWLSLFGDNVRISPVLEFFWQSVLQLFPISVGCAPAQKWVLLEYYKVLLTLHQVTSALRNRYCESWVGCHSAVEPTETVLWGLKPKKVPVTRNHSCQCIPTKRQLWAPCSWEELHHFKISESFCLLSLINFPPGWII